MLLLRYRMVMGLAAGLLLPLLGSTAQAQREPDIGYVYPPGGQVATTVTVTIGGQFLDGATGLHVSGQGVVASDLEFEKPLTNFEVNVLQDKIEKAREKLKEEGKEVDLRRRQGAVAEFLKLLKEVDVTEIELQKLEEYRERRNDKKRQLNPQLEQTVTAKLKIAADAAPGRRDLRVETPTGLSNPLGFHISPFPNFLETEPNDASAGEAIVDALPAVLNGQIMPGDVDRFRFEAKKGQRLVLITNARELMPYLADAVPGWFQATLALYDQNGREVAYADDYQFDPDPVLYYRIPQDGFYEVEIKDSIFRGREDFVYRIEVGELPFVKAVFPLGAHVGEPAKVEVDGWNLPVDTVTLDYQTKEVGKTTVSVPNRKRMSNEVPFEVDDLPEILDQEPNNDLPSAQLLKPPCIVNGRIDVPGDWDVFRFDGRVGGQVTLEVVARRLNSPLDSLLKVTDADGKQLVINDDTEDKGSGLVTHHADSQLQLSLPDTGAFYIHLGDTQKKGGQGYTYRLRVSARRPDFDLRVVPSGINARPGSVVPLTVYALRRDGFNEDIRLELLDPPPGFALSGGWVPANEESEELTLTIPPNTKEDLYVLRLVGRAEIKGREIVRTVVPADDMMQAFIYHHLVPAEELLVSVSGKALVRAGMRRAGKAVSPEESLRIPSGGTVRYQLPIPNRPNLNDVQVELSNPPDGITILRMIRGLGGLVMLFSADAEMAKPGLKGNLVLNVFVERTIPGRNGKPGSKAQSPRWHVPRHPVRSCRTVTRHSMRRANSRFCVGSRSVSPANTGVIAMLRTRPWARTFFSRPACSTHKRFFSLEM